MVAPHFLHLILTVLPATFSSTIVYFAWHDWHEIFIAALPGPAERRGSTHRARAKAVWSSLIARIALSRRRDQGYGFVPGQLVRHAGSVEQDQRGGVLATKHGFARVTLTAGGANFPAARGLPGRRWGNFCRGRR